MLSFHVKFVQTDRQTTVKQHNLDLSIRRHKNLKIRSDQNINPAPSMGKISSVHRASLPILFK